MNKELIKQVQAGTHCISLAGNTDKETVKKIHTLLKKVMGNFPYNTTWLWDYYWVEYMQLKNKDRECPPGLTPIPLDDFFKEEEDPFDLENTFGDFGDVIHHPDVDPSKYSNVKPATPSPTLPECVGYGYLFLLDGKRVFIAADNIAAACDTATLTGKRWSLVYHDSINIIESKSINNGK